MSEHRNETALTLAEFFPDSDLVSWVEEHYGRMMSEHVREVLADDPEGLRGFTRAVRLSLTHEIEREI